MPPSLYYRNGRRLQHSIYQHIYGLRRDRILRAKTGTTMGICFVGILVGGNLLASFVSEKIAAIIHYTPLGLYYHVLKTDVTWYDIGQTAGISLLWIIGLGAVGYYIFQKAELK